MARPTPWLCKAAAGVDSPATQHVELWALFSTRGVKKFSAGLGALQRTELPWSEMLHLTCVSSLSAQPRDGYAPRDQTNHPVQLPSELIPLISLQTHEVNLIGLDPKQDGCTMILISATHRV